MTTDEIVTSDESVEAGLARQVSSLAAIEDIGEIEAKVIVDIIAMRDTPASIEKSTIVAAGAER